jgi:hypothetical protein
VLSKPAAFYIKIRRMMATSTTETISKICELVMCGNNNAVVSSEIKSLLKLVPALGRPIWGPLNPKSTEIVVENPLEAAILSRNDDLLELLVTSGMNVDCLWQGDAKGRHWKDHFLKYLRSDQDHRLKIDLRSDQDHMF